MSKLRPYQTDAIKKATNGLRRELDRVQVVSLPTGAGKTLVALTIMLRFLRRHPTGRVLWLAHRWDLLEQTWRKLEQINTKYAQKVARIGGSGTPLNHLRECPDSQILFTTLQTWHARLRIGTFPQLINGQPVLVVVDECHWAATASLGQDLLDEYLGRARMLGLSATPRIHKEKYRVVAAQSFADLCPQFLAKPQVHEVRTGTLWDPTIRAGQITSRSLADLGNRSARNEKIVQEYRRGASVGHYGRTLMFACDINHAEQLNELLSQKGVACRCVHSGRTRRDNGKAIDEFRKGRTNVLVTVAMLSEGFDVPEIDTIFLVRPTASLTLLAQMIGRGARKTRKKNSFTIVEFTDSVGKLGSQIFHAREYVSTPSRRRRRSPKGAAPRHQEPRNLPKFESLGLPGVEDVTFARDQTFGVEIELSCQNGPLDFEEPEWQDAAKETIAYIRDVAQLPVHRAPLDYHESDDPKTWRVCFDGSCGIEVVSPILVNGEGFAELARVCGALDQLVEDRSDLCVDRHAGLHVTLATRLSTARRREGFAARLTRLEPGLFTLVAPSRLYNCHGSWSYNRRGRNPYCQPLREMKLPAGNISFGDLADRAGRHRSVNLQKAHDRMRLLEIRMHQGTTDARKIISWIGLWMQVFNRSRYAWRGDIELGPVLPGGNTNISLAQAMREDIFTLLNKERIYLPYGFEQILRERREELRPYWSQAVPKRVRSWARAGWYSENTFSRPRFDGVAAARA